MRFLIIGIFMLAPSLVWAGCLESRGDVCGDKRICISDRTEAANGRKDEHSCLPDLVCKALQKIASEFATGDKKVEIEVASAQRLITNNGSRGGALRSHHLRCNAADILVPDYQKSTTKERLTQVLLKIPGVGKNVYCSGRAHVSISPREHFYDTCHKDFPKKRKKRRHR